MKKILLFTFLSLFTFCISFLFINDLEASQNVVLTPNGTAAMGRYISSEEYNLEQQQNKHAEIIAQVPNVELVYPASPRFNCLSYAFYSQDCENNRFWMDDGNEYINDGSYVDSDWNEGDILCYRDNSDPERILHAAIIVANPNNIENDNGSLNNSVLDEVYAVSKWGYYGVYMHSVLDYIKYTQTNYQLTCYKPKTHGTIEFSSEDLIKNNVYNIDYNKYVMYKVDLIENQNYSFVATANNELEIRLYNSQMNLITNEAIEFTDNSYMLCKYLNSGTYYFRVSYKSSLSAGVVNIRVRKLNNELNSGLVIDPRYENMQGTQISILEKEVIDSEKSYYSNIITQGFTRLIFFTNGESRLNYYWLSSDESVLSVTQYGTVLGKRVTETKNAKVYIISKTDPTIIYVLDFVIVPYNGDKIIINLDMTMNINDEEDVYIQLNSDVPYIFLQYYTWIPQDYSYCVVDDFGRINAKKTGTVVIKGTYLLNNKVEVFIDLTIA